MSRRLAVAMAARVAAAAVLDALLLLVAPAVALAQERDAAEGLSGVGVADGWDWPGPGLKLVLVLVVILGMRWYVRRTGGPAGVSRARSRVELLETRGLGGHRSLQLVRLGDRAVLLGVTQERITPLLEVDDPEELARLTTPVETEEGGRSFASFLSGMTDSLTKLRTRRRDDGFAAAPAAVAAESVLRQRAATAAYQGMRVADLQRVLEGREAGAREGAGGELMPGLARRTRVLVGRRGGGLGLALLVLVVASGCVAADGTATVPDAGIGPSGVDGASQTEATGVQLLILLTFLSLAPAILVMVTSFTRIIIVLSLVRSAIGVPALPPNRVLIGIAFLMTVFVMAPVWQTVNEDALQPFLDGEIEQAEAMERAEAPVRTFMLAQVREADLELFVGMAFEERPESIDDVPTYVVIPGFILSELETAFQMGFIIFVPFLIIDIVVSSALLSLGMMMLPPAVISLPFKILLFVLVDGWSLILGSLATSFVL